MPVAPGRGQADQDQTPAPEVRARVLLAEDDDELRRLLARALRRDGFDVAEARDGLELLDLLDGAPAHGVVQPTADLVISDVRMPGSTGLDVLAWLRTTDGVTPVILMTAFGDRETNERAHQLGASAMLDKPVDLDDLRRHAIQLTKNRGVLGPAAPPESKRVLIVDDEPRIRSALQMLLAPPHLVITAASAEEALARIETGPLFDAILCDLMMPGMSGADLHAELTRRASPLAQRIGFMTGGAYHTSVEEYVRALPNPRIYKPFDKAILDALLRKLLAASTTSRPR